MKITIKDFIFYWVVFSIPPALYAIFLWATGTWQNYVDFNWLLNMKMLQTFSPLRHLPFNASERFLLTAGMIGFIFLFAYSLKVGKINRLHGFVILTGIVLVASLFLVKAPWQQYFLAASPFFALASAFALRRLFSARMAKLGLIIFVFLATLVLVYETESGEQKKHIIAEIEYVLSASASEDLYFGYDYRRNLFRRDADFFWFCQWRKGCVETYQSFRDYDFDPVRIIQETRPKVIGASSKIAAFHKRYLKDHPDYKRSEEYPRFYIRKDD